MFSKEYIRTIAEKLGIKKEVKTVPRESYSYTVVEDEKSITVYLTEKDPITLAEALAISKLKENDPLITAGDFEPLFPEDLKKRFTFLVHPIQMFWAYDLLRKCEVNDVYSRILSFSEFTLKVVAESTGIKRALNNPENFSIVAEHFLTVYDHYRRTKTDSIPHYLSKILDLEELKGLHTYLKYLDVTPSSRVYLDLADLAGIPVAITECKGKPVFSIKK